MVETLLAIDVGGSNTRAYLVDMAGRCLGRGRGRGGNPASNTPEQGALAIIGAVEAAVADAGLAEINIRLALMALAGPEAHIARGRLEEAFRAVGLTGNLIVSGDLLAMFSSMTPLTNGYCVVAGTGAGAIRVRDGVIDRVVDAAGWLLGDTGSGYWLGHQAARAVSADLDRRGPQTALTRAMLAEMGIEWSDVPVRYGRPAPLANLTDTIYAMRPIELARFAPLVIANKTDPVAAELIAAAEERLTSDFATAYDPTMPGPVAFGGSVARHYDGLEAKISEVIRAAGHEPELHQVADGSIGAVVLVLRAVGITVDQTMFETIAASLSAPKAAVDSQVV